MKKILFCLICVIIWSFTCLFGGYILGKKLTKPIAITKYETQWKDKIVYRDYSNVPVSDLIEDLKCYDTAEFKLDINKSIREDKYRIVGSLCERSAYKDIEIEGDSSGNWRLYAGIGVIGVASGMMLYHFGR